MVVVLMYVLGVRQMGLLSGVLGYRRETLRCSEMLDGQRRLRRRECGILPVEVLDLELASSPKMETALGEF